MSIIIQSAGTVPHGMTVDKFGRGRVFSTSTTQEHHAASVVAEAFELSTVGGSASPYVPLVIATVTDGVVLSIQNQNAAKTMSIQKMVLSADVAGLTVTLVKNMVRGTLANNTSIIPPNINFNSGNAASVNADKWDGVGTGITGLTVGTPMSQSTLGVGSTVLPIDGSYIIGSGNELSFHVNNPTAGAINLSLSMRFFFESVTA